MKNVYVDYARFLIEAQLESSVGCITTLDEILRDAMDTPNLETGNKTSEQTIADCNKECNNYPDSIIKEYSLAVEWGDWEVLESALVYYTGLRIMLGTNLDGSKVIELTKETIEDIMTDVNYSALVLEKGGF